MRMLSRLILASLLAIAILSCFVGAGPVAGASVPRLRVLHAGVPAGLLAPGATITVQTSGLGTVRGAYCLGLTSLRDRYGIPVNLGTLLPVDAGQMTLDVTIPLKVFPAEPPGPFLLFVGHCTNVAPDGVLARVTVQIVQAAG
jgi:hypothetical protein